MNRKDKTGAAQIPMWDNSKKTWDNLSFKIFRLEIEDYQLD